MECECERVLASSESIESQNPHPTIRILVIDDDITTLSIVSSSLKTCATKLGSMVQLSVVTMRSPIDALAALRERDFDLVVTDLHMPEMDGIQLQKQVDAEFNLPVVIMSSNDSESVILSSLHSGVAFYIVKPFKDDDLKNIWQYAITSRKGKSLLIIDEELKSDHSFMQNFKAIIIGRGENGCSSNSSAGEISYEEVNSKEDQEEENGRKECKKRGRSNSKEDKEDNHIPAKKAKLVWTNSLHNRFLQAVHYIGLEKAVPKKILECMNVPGLTRENVASHLQKYRLFLKKVAEQGLSSIKNLSEESLRFITSFDSSLMLENGQQNYYSQWLEEQQLDQEGNMSLNGQNRQPSTGASSAQFSHYENARAFENSLMGFQQESLMFGNKNPFYDQHNPRFESDSTNNSRFMSLSGMNNNNINVAGQKDVGMFSSLGQEPAGFFPVRFENAKQMPPVLTSFNQENGGSGIINPSAFNNPMNNHSIFFNNANISTHQPQFHHQDDFTRELLFQPMNFTTPNNQLQGIGGAMNLNFTDNGNVGNNSHPNFSEEARGNPVVADPDNMYQIDNTSMIQNWDDGFKNDLFGSDPML